MTIGRHLGSKLIASLAVAGTAAVAAGCAGNGPVGNGTSAAPDGTSGLQRRFVNVVKTVSPAVVQIRTAQALGSGIVFDGQGDVVTNAHVVDNATHVVVTLGSGDSHPGTVVGRDVGNDLAVIRVSGAQPTPAVFADSSKLQVGDLAFAIGNPLGLRSSVTQGIVSAVGRSVPEGNGVTLASVIQTSAEINPGNSGGALANLSGQVIGIPTLAALDPQMGGSQAPGIGFAIDSNTVRRIATGLIRSG
jgi:S1-C subfamily serine protease